MVEFTTSWECENLGKCLKIVHLKEQGDNASFFSHFDPDSVELEQCARLERIDENDGIDDHCTVKFDSKSYDIGTLVIVSEARRLEVFKGGGGEYIKTVSGSRLEGTGEEMKIYIVEANLDALALSSLSVRLTGVSESCWIMSCQIGLLERDNRTAAHGNDRFNLKQLDGVELSDKAKEFRKLMESMRPHEEHNFGAVGALLPRTLISASISGDSSVQGPLPALPTVDQIDSLERVFSHPTTIESSQSPSNANLRTDNSGGGVLKALSSIEERIISRIEDMRKEQDEKLDRIMTLLEHTRCTCNNSC